MREMQSTGQTDPTRIMIVFDNHVIIDLYLHILVLHESLNKRVPIHYPVKVDLTCVYSL